MGGIPRIEGYSTEVNLEAARWAATLASKVSRGWALTVDYGYPRDVYYAPERRNGTLQSYAGHARNPDPLANPGFCDLTAHVEFTSVARAFLDAGMQLAGYTDQHHFLTGLTSRIFAGRAPSPQETRALKTLLHPKCSARHSRCWRFPAGSGLSRSADSSLRGTPGRRSA